MKEQRYNDNKVQLVLNAAVATSYNWEGVLWQKVDSWENADGTWNHKIESPYGKKHDYYIQNTEDGVKLELILHLHNYRAIFWHWISVWEEE